MRKVSIFAAVLLAVVSVFAEKPKPPTDVVSSSQLFFTFSDPELLPEDIIYSEQTKEFYVSSVRKRTVMSCNRRGVCQPVLKAKGERLYSMLGLAYHEAIERRLWVLTASLGAEQNHRAEDTGKSALLSIELYNGMIYTRIEPPGEGQHALGDLTQAKDGTLYISDGASGDLFFLRPGSDELERLVPKGTFRSPQTPALSSDGGTLYVPDYSKGIAAVRLQDRSVTWLEAKADLRGIDGMYFYKDSLIAIQNGTDPKRIVRFRLGKDHTVTESQVLEMNTPDLGEPTHGYINNGWLYFLANTGWDRVAEDGSFKPGRPAQLRRLRLP